jgi:tight adherence protein C
MVPLIALAPAVIIVPLCAALAVAMIFYAMLPQNGDLQRRLENFGGGTSQAAKQILIFDSLFSEKSRSQTTRRLQEAGWYKITPPMFLSYQLAAVACGFGLTALGLLVLKFDGLLAIICVLLPGIAYITPSFMLDSAVKTRKMEIACEVPDFLDAVATAVGAGVALNAALLNAVEVVPGALGTEFRACLAEVRMGRSRADALNAMSARVGQQDLSQVVTAIVQSERVGGNISQVLEELAAEARNRRFTRAEEIAAVLPLKMTFPMAFFLLPALFVMIFAPVFAGMQAGQ